MSRTMSENNEEIEINEFKNCYFKEDKAYTEDKILVYNLCLYKITKKHSEADVYKFFAQFGPLEKLYFVYDGTIPNSRSHNVGFANYTNPADAAKVLKNCRAAGKKKQIWFRAGDSWCQPRKARLKSKQGFDLNIENTDDIYSNDYNLLKNVENNSQLLNLNDDCLEVICMQLDLRSQIYFSYVCQRFRRIFEMCCKSQYRILDVDKLNHMTLWEIRHFFQSAGRYIEKIVTLLKLDSRERIVEFIGNFCPNVKVVSLVLTFGRFDAYFRDFCKNLKLLNTLELHKCFLRDSYCLAFHKLQSLEHLGIEYNRSISGIHLYKLRRLKSLTLYGCSRIKEGYLISIIESLTELKALNISASSPRVYSTTLYSTIAKCNKHLEDLKIVCYTAQQYEYLTMLSKLRRLQILAHAYPPTSFFVQLAERQEHQLEYLEVFGENYITYERAKLLAHLRQLKYLACGNNIELNNDCLRKFSELQELEELVVKRCPAITNEGLLQLLFRCKKLKILNIQSCRKITNAFVFDAIELFQERAQQQQSQLTCRVGRTKITKDILNDPRFIAGKAFIKLSFENVRHMLENDPDDVNDNNLNQADNENFQNIENDANANLEDNLNHNGDIQDNDAVDIMNNVINGNQNENNEEHQNDNNDMENYANDDQNNFNENGDDQKPDININEVECYDFYELFDLTIGDEMSENKLNK